MCNERRIQGSGVSDTISLAVQSSAVLDSKDFTVIPYSDTVGLLEQKARSALKMPRSARLWRVGHNNQREPLGKSEQTLEETSITDREVLFL
ncbi:hypothetical protein FKM82_016699 [Ascaphus truei]